MPCARGQRHTVAHHGCQATGVSRSSWHRRHRGCPSPGMLPAAQRGRRGARGAGPAQGWQPRPPHTARASCLTPRRQQLAWCTEPPPAPGQPQWPRAHRDPSSPALEPGTQPNPDLQVLPLPARSTVRPGRGERERERRGEHCAHPQPPHRALPGPHPPPVQVCAGTPPHSHPAPPQGHG